MNSDFSKERLQMTNSTLKKKCPGLPVVRKMRIQNTIWFGLALDRMTIIPNILLLPLLLIIIIINAGEEMGGKKN